MDCCKEQVRYCDLSRPETGRNSLRLAVSGSGLAVDAIETCPKEDLEVAKDGNVVVASTVHPVHHTRYDRR